MFSSSSRFDPDKDTPDLTGQIIIVTGGNIGLGLETIRQLAKHNPAHVYLAARSQAKAESAIQDLKSSNPTSAPISFLHLDLSSFASIKTAASTFLAKESRLDVLINNAGIMMTDAGLTKEGYEIQFGTNHMGHALLIELLLPILQATASNLNSQTRVVSLASASERMATARYVYDTAAFKTPMEDRSTQARYCLSKLANIHYSHTLALQRGNPQSSQAKSNGKTHENIIDGSDSNDRKVKFIAVHPGMVATNLHQASSGFFLRAFLYTAINLFATSVEKGAYSQLWAAVSPEATNGEFYGPVGIAGAGSSLSRDMMKAEELWKWTQEELKNYL